jgi:hypothetical protein
MPESVTDRPTKAHEYLFLLSKSPRYYYDADAVREDAIRAGDIPGGTRRGIGEFGVKPGWGNGEVPSARNLRSVWSIATQPYPGAHFATFPEKLVEPCILAGTSAKGVCPECGAPWVREVQRTNPRLTDPEYVQRQATPKMASASSAVRRKDYGTTETGLAKPGWRQLPPTSATTTGWRPACQHFPADEVDYTDPRIGNAQTVPATILDPFAGSGTVGRVAARLSRRAVLIDLNADYLGQAMKRNQDIPLGLEA